MINYIYTTEKTTKDEVVKKFKESSFSEYPHLNHSVPLNSVVCKLSRTKYKKSGKKNYSYFYCDKDSEYLLIDSQLPIIYMKISSCGTYADCKIEKTNFRVKLSLQDKSDSVYAIKGPFIINNVTYELMDSYYICLSDPHAPNSGNASVTGYNQSL